METVARLRALLNEVHAFAACTAEENNTSAVEILIVVSKNGTCLSTRLMALDSLTSPRPVKSSGSIVWLSPRAL